MMINTKINRENYVNGNVGSSNSVVEETRWSSLWKTSVPSKIEVFLWRLAKESIPTADVLSHRNMVHRVGAVCVEARTLGDTP
jgi:hypothetical protein